MLSYAREVLPYTAFQLVADTLKQVQAGAGGAKLSFGILATLWAASSGMGALMSGLNRAYEAKEMRPWWKEKLVALVLTVLLSVFVIVSITLVLYGSRLADLISGYFGLLGGFHGSLEHSTVARGTDLRVRRVPGALSFCAGG